MRADLQPQEITRFLGVNLRQDRADLADDEVAKAINADFNTTIGTILVRNGKSKLFSGALTDTTIRTITKVNSIHYQVAGQSVYRNQSRIITDLLSANLQTSIQAFRPLSDTDIWAFIADGSVMKKDNGTNTYNWGIESPGDGAPGVIVAAGTPGITGSYRFKFSYARELANGTIAHESNGSGASEAVAASANDFTVTALYSDDPQVTHVRLYRTVSGGENYLFDQQVANIVGGGMVQFTSNQADNTLGSELEIDNDPPPNCSMVRIFNETAFLLGDPNNPHYLYHSKRFRPESVTTFLEIGNADDSLITMASTAGVLGVFTRVTKYRISGNASQGYVALEHLARRGTPSRDAAVATEYGVVFPAKDGIFLTNFMGQDIAMADAILPLFYGETVNGLDPINWNVASTFCGAARKNRYYFSYASGSNSNPDKVAVFSHDTKKWYFYNYPARSLYVEEDLDRLLAGSTDGFVYILETGTDDAGANISLDIQTKDYFGGSPHTRKLFLFYRVDAYVPSGTMSADFYVDGVLKKQTAVTGDRLKTLFRAPKGCMGYHWRVNFTYTGAARAAIYGVAAFGLPLGST